MRIRTVKPEFWQSETLASVAPTSRLLAIALLNFADDEGLFWAVPQVIQGALFPFDEDSTNVRRGLDELSRIGFLELGTAEHGKRVGRVKNFKLHQKVDRPQASKIAGFSVVWDPFDEDSTNVRRGLDEDSTTEWKGMEGNGMEEEKEQPPKAPPRGRRTTKVVPVAPETYDDLFASIIPDYLRGEENLSQWHDWISYRNEHRQGKGRGTIVPLTEAAAKQSLRLLAKAKKGKSISSLIVSAISGEWDGLHIPYGSEEDFWK